MVSVSQRTTRRDGVTFAHVVVENASSERRRVRLAVECDGALWPPRRQGIPMAGWDEDAVTVTVAAGGSRGLGFATPVDANAVAVAVEDETGRGRMDDAVTTDAEVPSVDGVVRALGAFAPPLAATPREEPGVESSVDRDRFGREES
jgi:hypothetical protein